MFNRRNKQSNKGKKWLFEMLLASFLYKSIKNFFSKNEKNIEVNWREFLKEEEKEADKLVHHKESFRKYCHDSTNIFQDYFIPCACNDHRPKILRRKSLLIITLSLIFLKVFTVFYLFFIYPNDAKMSEFIESKIIVLINNDRSSSGTTELKTNDYLNSVAKSKAEDMIKNNYFAHKSLNGKMPWDWINKNKYEYLYVGENLAMNFTSAESAHKALMLSPSHKKNIMNDKYSEIGVAVIAGEINGETTNVMVEIFASKRPQTALVKNTPSQNTGPAKVMQEASVAVNKDTKVAGVENEQSFEKITTPEIIKEAESSPKKITVIKKPNIENKIPVAKTKTKDETISEKVAEEEIAQESVVALEETKQPAQDALPNQATIYKNMNTAENSNVTVALKIVAYSKMLLYGVLFFLFISLMINIFVRATIQHKPIIVESLISIAIIGTLIFTRIHILENLLDSVLVI